MTMIILHVDLADLKPLRIAEAQDLVEGFGIANDLRFDVCAVPF